MDDDDPTKKRLLKKKFLRVPAVAEELDWSERSVWREIENDKLKAHGFGGSTRISREDLDNYIRRSRR